MSKKNFIGLLFMVCIFVTFSGIEPPLANGQKKAESRLREILNSGELRVGTTGDLKPLTFKDPTNNEYKGFDIDIVKELAKDLGVKIKFVPTEWKTLVSGITSNKYDISTSASLNPKRAISAGYTDSYLHYYLVPITTKEKLSKFTDWKDLNKSNVKVAVTLGTVMEKMAKDVFPKAKIITIESPARDFQEVLAGRADACLTSNIEAASLENEYEQLSMVPITEQKKPTPIAWLTPQDDQIWINYLNHWIELKKSQGFIDKIMIKWNLKKL